MLFLHQMQKGKKLVELWKQQVLELCKEVTKTIKTMAKSKLWATLLLVVEPSSYKVEENKTNQEQQQKWTHHNKT